MHGRHRGARSSPGGQRTKDNVLGGEADLFHQDAVGARADAHLQPAAS